MVIFSSCSKSASPDAKKESYEFTTVSKGSIENTVTTSGTLEVVSSVDVLAEMSGRIENVYVNYNDHVKKGQILAKINTDLLKIQEKAAQSSVDKYQAIYDLQTLTVKNSKALFDKDLISDYDYKSAVATLNEDKADLASAKASLEQIQTEINQYAYITSPIDGIVLARDIDPGSSVTGGSVSSSTTLFTLTNSLAQMEIEAEVDELDIGSVKVGQEVRFTVAADSDQNFTGTVKEVRLVPETSDNLVYYYVIILADNSSGKLLPGMTATVNFIIQKKDNILTVPSAALRFTPASLSDAEKQRALFLANLSSDMSQTEREQAIAEYDATQKAHTTSGKTAKTGGLSSLISNSGGLGGPMMGGAPPQSQTQQTNQAEQSTSTSSVVRKPLWYIDDTGKLAAVMVQVGISDTTKTEIIGADSLEGKEVILKVKVN
jgi:HlyD family secretion protein